MPDLLAPLSLGRCAASDCVDASSSLFTNRCHFHEALGAARELSPERFEALLVALSNVKPLTEKQKDERRIASLLSWVTRQAKTIGDAEQSAREAGATDEQIAAARTIG